MLNVLTRNDSDGYSEEHFESTGTTHESYDVYSKSVGQLVTVILVTVTQRDG